MKKCLGIFVTALLALGISSCSEDFEVAAPYKNITVVYGMLNIEDTAQYVRIQKAFLDEHKSALEMAGIADSNFFRNITVRMKEVRNNVILSDIVMNRVDMNLEGAPKPPGTFFNSPNYAYKYNKILNTANRYRLVIINNETGNVDSAETGLLDTIGVRTDPNAFFVSPLFVQDVPINFSSNSPNTKITQNVSGPPNSKYFEGYIKFNYATEMNGSGFQKDTSFVWRFASAAAGADRSAQLTYSASEVLPIFRAFVPVAAAGEKRYLDSAEVFVWAGDLNYYNYAIGNQVSGGLTSDQIRPNYTTIRGKDVLGLFGARARKIKYRVPISNASLDSLKASRITESLRFVGRTDH